MTEQMELLKAIFNLDEKVLHSVEVNVRSRLSNLQIHIGVGQLETSDCTPVEEFYNKVLAHRRKRFNQKSSTRNLHLLRQAIYASHFLSRFLDVRRISEYHERKHT